MAWRDLVDQGDELLVDLVIDAVESKVGIRPDEEAVISFLTSVTQPHSPARAAETKSQAHAPANEPAHASKKGASKEDSAAVTRSGTLVILGKDYTYANAKEAMITVLGVLSDRDPGLLPKCYQNSGFRGRKRRYLARHSAELYPDRDDLRDYCEVVRDEWLVSTNLNNRLKLSIMKKAVEVAGLTWAVDVVVDL